MLASDSGLQLARFSHELKIALYSSLSKADNKQLLKFNHSRTLVDLSNHESQNQMLNNLIIELIQTKTGILLINDSRIHLYIGTRKSMNLENCPQLVPWWDTSNTSPIVLEPRQILRTLRRYKLLQKTEQLVDLRKGR